MRSACINFDGERFTRGLRKAIDRFLAGIGIPIVKVVLAAGEDSYRRAGPFQPSIRGNWRRLSLHVGFEEPAYRIERSVSCNARRSIQVRLVSPFRGCDQ